MRRPLRSLLAFTAALAAALSSLAAATVPEPGHALYLKSCAACHRPDGSGTARLGPALRGNALLAGPAAPLLAIVLHGPDTASSRNSQRFSTTMPGFAQLEDRQIADLVTYLRATFGGGAAPVTPAEVAAIRARR